MPITNSYVPAPLLEGYDGYEQHETVVFEGYADVGDHQAGYTLEVPSTSSALVIDNQVHAFINGLGLQQWQYHDVRRGTAALGLASLTVDPAYEHVDSHHPISTLSQSYVNVLEDLRESKDVPEMVDYESVGLFAHSLALLVATHMAENDYRVTSITSISGAGLETDVNSFVMFARAVRYGGRLAYEAATSSDGQTSRANVGLLTGQAAVFLRNPSGYVSSGMEAAAVSCVNRLIRLDEIEGVSLALVKCLADNLIRSGNFDKRVIEVMDPIASVAADHQGLLTEAELFVPVLVQVAKELSKRK